MPTTSHPATQPHTNETLQPNDWLHLGALIAHMKKIHGVFERYEIYDILAIDGSPAAAAIIGHIDDGMLSARYLERSVGDSIVNHAVQARAARALAIADPRANFRVVPPAPTV